MELDLELYCCTEKKKTLFPFRRDSEECDKEKSTQSCGVVLPPSIAVVDKTNSSKKQEVGET